MSNRLAETSSRLQSAVLAPLTLWRRLRLITRFAAITALTIGVLFYYGLDYNREHLANTVKEDIRSSLIALTSADASTLDIPSNLLAQGQHLYKNEYPDPKELKHFYSSLYNHLQSIAQAGIEVPANIQISEKMLRYQESFFTLYGNTLDIYTGPIVVSMLLFFLIILIGWIYRLVRSGFTKMRERKD